MEPEKKRLRTDDNSEEDMFFDKNQLNYKLLTAIQRDDIQDVWGVNYWLAKGADANAYEGYYIPPMHHAAERNYVTIMKKLYFHAAKLNGKSYDGDEPIHHAITPDKLDALHWLLSLKKDPHDDTNYVNVNTQNSHGETSLHLAVQRRDNNAVKRVALLLRHGAKTDIKDDYEKTAFHHAVNNTPEIMDELFLSAPEKINIPDNCGDTPLHHACEVVKFHNLLEVFNHVPRPCNHNKLAMVKHLLLRCKANPLLKNHLGYMPLQTHIFHCSEPDCKVKTFLRNAMNRYKDGISRPRLIIPISGERSEIVSRVTFLNRTVSFTGFVTRKSNVDHEKATSALREPLLEKGKKTLPELLVDREIGRNNIFGGY